MHEADDQPPVTTYYTTFAVIAALMVVTVLVSFSGMQQPWRVLLNLAIAGTQVGLLSWFFMHLRRSDRLTWVVASAGLFFTTILFVETLIDYIYRHLGGL